MIMKGSQGSERVQVDKRSAKWMAFFKKNPQTRRRGTLQEDEPKRVRIDKDESEGKKKDLDGGRDIRYNVLQEPAGHLEAVYREPKKKKRGSPHMCFSFSFRRSAVGSPSHAQAKGPPHLCVCVGGV